MFYDYGLFILLLVVLIATFLLGTIPGLIICLVIIFMYGSVIFFQMVTGAGEIWSLNYMWFIAYPFSAFFAGKISNNLRESEVKCNNCQYLTDKIVTIDEITGFGNGREFLRDLDIEMARSKRHKIDLVLGILEIQYFEELISIYGKENTKKIYKIIAQALNKASRVEDLRFRIDDDMLGLILPHTNLVDAEIVKTRIKEALSSLAIDDGSSLNRYNIELKISLVSYNDKILNPMEFKAIGIMELEYDV
ncbi:MAG: diguanylate cyclase [Acidaminobacteraceae bacterium]